MHSSIAVLALILGAFVLLVAAEHKQQYHVWRTEIGSTEQISLGDIYYNAETHKGQLAARLSDWQPTTELITVTIEEKSTGTRITRNVHIPAAPLLSLGFSDKGTFFYFDILSSEHEVLRPDEDQTVIIRGQYPFPATRPTLKRIDPAKLNKEEEEDNRSFFAKYWHVIIPIIVVLLLGGGGGEEPAQGGGARK
ncbi:hypothetical protein BDF22DRAFT_670495 [Syncephalis plumigaleata]|nr:hypothetical protein BDF22DRAFT_670495 [Syncephalis plumigaleata]